MVNNEMQKHQKNTVKAIFKAPLASDASSLSCLAAKTPLQIKELPIINVRDLVAEGKEAIILHDGEQYRLRITAKDKLILTK